ncbi:MAG: ABC transporter permease subunit, partial [Proteobacteria bacterium]|nr:ABC transporter permease subunit [Pseudomonadota bacterium]
MNHSAHSTYIARDKIFTAARLLGVFLLFLWALLAASAAYAVVSDYATYGKYFATFLRGAGTTLLLVGISLLIGAVLSLPLALARNSNTLLPRFLAYCYVYFFRGTPLIAQTFLVYYGFGGFREFFSTVHLWWLFRDPFYCALLVFSLNTAAYQAEILRGAIASVPRG